MRWILTWLAAVCLLAAVAVRPEDPRTRDPRAAHLDRGTAEPVLGLAARREAVDARDRLSPFVVPVAPSVASPPHALTAAPIARLVTVLDPVAPAPSARGPPTV